VAGSARQAITVSLEQMNQPSGRSFLSGVLWNTLLMAVALPAGIAASVVVGRVLGPSGKGEYTLALLLGNLAFTILNLGIPNSISYFLGGRRVPEGSFVKTAVALGGLLGAAAIAGALALDWTGWSRYLLGVRRLTPAMRVVAFALPFQFCAVFLQFVILAQGRRVLFAALPAIGQLLVSILIAAFALLGRLTPLTAVVASVASQALITGVLLRYLQRRVRWSSASMLPAKAWSRLAGYSSLSHAANIIQFLVQRVDVFLVSLFLDVRAVGLYSVAYGLAELLLLLPQRFNNLYIPRIAGQKDLLGKAEEVRLSSSLVFIGAVAAAAGLALIGPWGIRFFYGRQFSQSARPFLLLLPGVCGMAAASIQSAYLAGVGRAGANAAVAAIGLGLNIALNLLLIPRYGISGAAIASSLAYCTQAWLLILAVSRMMEARPAAMLISARPSVWVSLLKQTFPKSSG
jgi:O-antigen/teichoic acid export membrane protein